MSLWWCNKIVVMLGFKLGVQTEVKLEVKLSVKMGVKLEAKVSYWPSKSTWTDLYWPS